MFTKHYSIYQKKFFIDNDKHVESGEINDVINCLFGPGSDSVHVYRKKALFSFHVTLRRHSGKTVHMLLQSSRTSRCQGDARNIFKMSITAKGNDVRKLLTEKNSSCLNLFSHETTN